MFRSYLTVAVRNLFRQKFYSAINITGLGLGIACVILIMLFVKDQSRYDAHHVRRDRIHRVMREFRSENGQKTYDYRISGAAGPALAQDFPEIEATVRIMPRNVWVRHDDKTLDQVFCLADPNILDVFTFPMLRGDTKALAQPQSVLITESAAKKFFGKNDPIGELISVEGSYVAGDYTITGIIRDVPKHSTLQFDFLSASVLKPQFVSWDAFTPQLPFRVISVYILLREDADAESIESKLPAFIEHYMGAVAETNTYFLQPLKEVYLYSVRDYGILGTSKRDEDGIEYGNISNVYTASFVAFFILLIACINFTNLATARSANRAKEVGLRKVVGAGRIQLAIQFLGESLLLTVMSMAIAICILEFALPIFNDYTGNLFSLNFSGAFILQLTGLALVVSLIAGAYPALYLSHFRPIEVLKGSLTAGSRSGILRKVLVVSQFGISVVLIVVTILAFEQTSYIQNKNLGFDKDNIVEIPIFWEHRYSSEVNRSPLWIRYKAVKEAFLQHPNVKAATISRFQHGRSAPLVVFRTYEGGIAGCLMRLNEVDEDFIKCFNIELIAGRSFSIDAALYGAIAANRIRIATDQNATTNTRESEYILNEAAIKMLGWTDPIGKKFGLKGQKPGRVVGVVKNFHVRSLHEPIEPTVLFASPGVAKTLFLKISSEHFEETVAFMEQTWDRFLPTRPFTYTFLDENLNRQYGTEQQFGKAMGVFSLLAIFVGCLGLLGLMSFMAEQRRKEVGIRKVLGASEMNIVALLITETFKLVLIACLLAWPVAYYVINKWLQDYAYRIEIGIGTFLLGGLLALAIALMTVSSQALKAALANPVDALRYE